MDFVELRGFTSEQSTILLCTNLVKQRKLKSDACANLVKQRNLKSDAHANLVKQRISENRDTWFYQIIWSKNEIWQKCMFK